VFLSEIRNYSSAAARRVEITVGIAYKEDVAKVVEIIKNNLKETPLVLVEPEPDIYINDFGDSAVNINVWCWVPFSVFFDVKKQLMQQIKYELDSNNIEIPFPQRVVYLAKSDGKDGSKAAANITDSGEGVQERLSLDEYAQQQND
jgi:small-conductance mechanosensitive channel